MRLAAQEAKTTLHAETCVQINPPRLEVLKTILALRGNDQRRISDRF